MSSLSPPPVRYGCVIRVRPERFEEYKRHHAAVWPEVLATITRCHIRNYSIYHQDGFLFGYYEYHGRDHAADMKIMAAAPSFSHSSARCGSAHSSAFQ